MTKAFVSYSRRDTEFTRKLTDALIAEKMDLWVDWKNIPPTVDWKLQIQKGVEEADTFLFLISPDSVKSGECAEEIAHAVNNKKRIITLLVRKHETELPPALKHINWIDFSKDDCFDESFQQLLQSINTDYEWLQFHTQLQGKALEWDRHNKDNSLLLRGMELETVEGQLVVNASKEPGPTELQRDYVLESKKAKEAEQKARERQRRIITIASVVVAVAMLVLAGWAWGQKIEADNQRDQANKAKLEAQRSQKAEASAAEFAQKKQVEAENSAKTARINEIIGLAVAKKDQDYNEALLYSVEAYRRAEESNINVNNAKTALLTTLQDRRGLLQILPGHNDWISKVAYSSDGNTLATSSYDEVIILWDTTDPANPINVKQLHGHDVAISPNNKILATAGYDKDYNSQITLWDISDKANPKQINSFIGADSLIAFSSDNSKLVAGTWECSETGCNSINQIWNVSDLSVPLGTVPGDNPRLSSNGQILVTTTYDETNLPYVTLWNIATPDAPVKLSTISGNYGVISPENTVLAVFTYDKGYNSVIQLWDISNPGSPQKSSEFLGNSDWVSSIAFSSQGNKLLIGNDNGSIFIWDITDPASPWTSPSTNTLNAHTSYVNFITFRPDSSIFSTGGSDSKVMTWDLNKIKNPIQFDMPEGIASGSEDGKIAFSRIYDDASGNFINQLWDISTPSKPVKLGVLNDPNYINNVEFSADHRSLLTTIINEDNTTTYFLWDISDPSQPAPYQFPDSDLNTTSFSPDGRFLYTETYDYTAALWDISNPGKPTRFETPTAFSRPTYSPDNDILVYTDWNDGVVVFWDVKQSGQFKKLGTLDGNEIVFSSDGKMVAVTTNDEKPTVELWDISNWKTRKLITTVEGSTPTLITDRNLIVTQIGNEESSAIDLHFWDISDPSTPVEKVLKGHTRYINSIVLSPDRQMLASASDDRTVILWNISDPKNPKEYVTLKGHRGGVYTVKFSNDGSTLASASSDGGVFLWDVTVPSKVNQLAYLKVSNWSVDSLAFGSDGKTLITSDGISGIVIWDLDPNSWVDKACRIANSNFTTSEWKQLFFGDEYRLTCPNVGVASASHTQPVEAVTSGDSTSTTLPLCTDALGVESSCPLVTWNASENERDRFCLETVSYTLYAMPEGTTLTPIDEGFTCTDEGVRGGFQMYTCYSLDHPNRSFQANMCNTSCQVSASDQCQAGLGLDSSEACCAPVSTDGCTQVTLEVGTCE